MLKNRNEKILQNIPLYRQPKGVLLRPGKFVLAGIFYAMPLAESYSPGCAIANPFLSLTYKPHKIAAYPGMRGC